MAAGSVASSFAFYTFYIYKHTLRACIRKWRDLVARTWDDPWPLHISRVTSPRCLDKERKSSSPSSVPRDTYASAGYLNKNRDGTLDNQRKRESETEKGFIIIDECAARFYRKPNVREKSRHESASLSRPYCRCQRPRVLRQAAAFVNITGPRLFLYIFDTIAGESYARFFFSFLLFSLDLYALVISCDTVTENVSIFYSCLSAYPHDNNAETCATHTKKSRAF